MKFKNFIKLIIFEIKKIFRSKFVFYFLLLAPLIMAFFIATISNAIDPLSNYYKDNNSNIETDDESSNTNVVDQIVFISDSENVEDNETINAIKNALNVENDIEWGTNLDKALYDLKLSNISLIVYIDGEDKITILYDLSNNLSTKYKDLIVLRGYEYAYKSVKEALSEWGIDINGFDVNTDNIGDKELPLVMRIEPLSMALIIGFLLTVGITYTTSRDNETGVIKQLNYTPMKTGRYIAIRSIFFAILTMLQILVILLVFGLMGANQRGIYLQLFGIGALFSIAFMGLCFIFATTKNQLSTISLAVITIIIPAVVSVMGISSVSNVLKIILYLSPLTAFIQLFNTYLNYEIINLIPLIILSVEAVVYYLSALIIFKLKTNKKIKNN